MQARISAIAILSVVFVRLLAAQNQVSPALQSLVDAERAFAQTATEKGIRDSFLEYFADDAIAFEPAPTSATARLRSRPSRPFSDAELVGSLGPVMWPRAANWGGSRDHPPSSITPPRDRSHSPETICRCGDVRRTAAGACSSTWDRSRRSR